MICNDYSYTSTVYFADWIAGYGAWPDWYEWVGVAVFFLGISVFLAATFGGVVVDNWRWWRAERSRVKIANARVVKGK